MAAMPTAAAATEWIAVAAIAALAPTALPVVAAPPFTVVVTVAIAERIVITVIAEATLARVGIAIATVTVIERIPAIAIVERIATPSFAVGDTSGLRIGIEPLDPTLGRHPLDSIMRTPVGSHEGAIGVGEGPGMLLTDLRQDLIERSAIPRGRGSDQATHGDHSENCTQNAGTHGLFLAFAK
jgi:hypothetical protein